MSVTCDECGLPTDDPKVMPDNRYLCEECNLVCRKCHGEGGSCLNCSGTGLEPKFDPDADVFG